MRRIIRFLIFAAATYVGVAGIVLLVKPTSTVEYRVIGLLLALVSLYVGHKMYGLNPDILKIIRWKRHKED